MIFPLVTLPGTATLVADIIALLILWIIVSIPVYFAAKLLVGPRAHFGSAMLATLVGPIVFAIVYGLGYYLTSSFFVGLGILALLLAFLAWIWVYKAVFHTGWLHAFGIAILAIVIAIILLALLALLGVLFHAFTHVFRMDILAGSKISEILARLNL
jgi:hypothetical protein